MEITCEKCTRVLRVDGTKIPEKGAYARCPKCQSRIFIKKTDKIEKQAIIKEKITCPKCGYQQFQSDTCLKCGIIFSKWQQKQKATRNTTDNQLFSAQTTSPKPSKNKILGSFWPSITDVVTAKKASQQGYWACLLIAGTTILLVVLSFFGIRLLGFDQWALIDAFLFIVIGWGIYKMNRIAAIAGPALYILERISMGLEYGLKNPIMVIIISFMFINSVRGIFAYHKYGKETVSASDL